MLLHCLIFLFKKKGVQLAQQVPRHSSRGWESQGLCPGFFSQLPSCYQAVTWAGGLQGFLFVFLQHQQGWYCDWEWSRWKGSFSSFQKEEQGRGSPGEPEVSLYSWSVLHPQPSRPHLPTQPQYRAQDPKYDSLLNLLCSDREPSRLRPCPVKKLLWWTRPPAPTCQSHLLESPSSVWFEV